MNRSVPTAILPEERWQAVAAGYHHAVALRADGTLWTWGKNNVGQLGLAPLVARNVPTLVLPDDRWVAVAGGAAHTVAVREDGSLWACGQNSSGELGNARFLILPWVRCPNLASKALSLALSRLSADFQQRYGYSPVLVESFVEEDRFAGTAYRAANWLRVGRTQGRGKLGQWQDPRVPRKAIWVYPLHSRFRQILTGATPAQP